MGCRASKVGPEYPNLNNSTNPNGTDNALHSAVEKQLQLAADEEKRVIKCLLLGAGECGKSTILKQMKILHLNGFNSPQDKLMYTSLIHKNTLDSIQTLIAACIQLNIPYDSKEQKERSERLINISPDHINVLDIKSDIQALWQDNGIRRAYLRSNEFHLLDSAAYFLDNIDRIYIPNYDPPDADILRSRLATTGIIETVFKIDKLTFKMYDVGGQRGERKKWIHCKSKLTCEL
jgi:hypothetical protein